MVNAELQPVLDNIAIILIQRSQNFTIAESCTGGLVSALITSQAGSSNYYKGGVISYCDSVKEQSLGVPKALLKSVGAVSRPVAKLMAEGVRQNLSSDWGLSVTGIAGPSGGSIEKPVGTVFFSWVGPSFEKTECKNFGATLKREEIQKASAIYCLTEFQKHLH
jgi:PncC family amidohydrolase